MELSNLWIFLGRSLFSKRGQGDKDRGSAFLGGDGGQVEKASQSDAFG